jgi:hypothetical protein
MVSNLQASSHIDAKLVDKEVNAHLKKILLVNDIAIISIMKYYFSSHANTCSTSLKRYCIYLSKGEYHSYYIFFKQDFEYM